MDFGHLVASSRVVSREVLLYNNGTKEGEFKIKYAGDKPLSFIPSSGSVPAKSAIPIKVLCKFYYVLVWWEVATFI